MTVIGDGDGVKPKAEDEDDEWGAVPSFLRRPKIK